MRAFCGPVRTGTRMTGRIHIVGAGLAGLSAAVRLTQAGRSVRLYEAAPFAGGRCRTFHDPRLGCDVDNGNHLVLTGNHRTRSYLSTIGASERMLISEHAVYPFLDFADGAHWRVRLNNGFIPWWTAVSNRRIAGTHLGDYLRAVPLAFAGKERTVGQVITERGTLWRRFWEPLSWAVLNTTPERGSARLLYRVLAETFLRGARNSLPMFAPGGLGQALVGPAVAWLRHRGVELHTGLALKELDRNEHTARCLLFEGCDPVDVSNGSVILALPPSRLRGVVPWIDVPDDASGILNAHFVVPDLPRSAPSFLGIVGGTTHWIFVRGNVVSLTVSAADRLGHMSRDPDELVPELWAEVGRALNFDGTYTAARINKERRATFDQAPEQVRRRPGARTELKNLFLAGDATDTGLPATIEGAIRSGETAARLAA